MALTHAKWREFTPKAICDTTKSAEVSLCLTCESRAKVDELIARAVAAGGSKEPEPTDHGFMYLQGFDDPDGHHWELVNMSGMPPQPMFRRSVRRVSRMPRNRRRRVLA